MTNNFHSFGAKFHIHRIQFMKTLTVLLLLFLSFFGSAQPSDNLIHQLEQSKNDIDKINVLITISEESIYKQPDLTVKYSEQLLELSKKRIIRKGKQSLISHLQSITTARKILNNHINTWRKLNDYFPA